jgi:hypothetical protein
VKQIRKRLTYANVMSSLAVFLVLGGASAYAVKKVGSNEIKGNSITTGKLKKEAVTTAKVKNSAISTNKIANEAVTSAKLADNAVTTSKIADDAVTGAKVKESSLSEVPSANKANQATSATLAESAQPQVFAKVNTNGTVDAANSKGLTSANVTTPAGEGVYCITVPEFVPRGGQVSTQFGGSAGTTAQITIGGTGNCPFPQVQVLTWTGGAAPAASNLTFYVELYH